MTGDRHEEREAHDGSDGCDVRDAGETRGRSGEDRPGERPHAGSGFAYDVVGIGALNLDYIHSADLQGQGGGPAGAGGPPRLKLIRRIANLLPEGRPAPEWGTEAAVDEDIVYAALEAADTSRLRTSLGGSAYNALHTLAHLQLDLRLGYVGVAGRVPGPGLSAVQQLRADGIDHRFVAEDDGQLCGVCFSFTEDGERTLLTHAGANTAMAAHLDRSFEPLVDYLASARIVHVTSFLDPDTPPRLLELLRAVKRASPATLISVDPGHVWAGDATGPVAGIVAAADYLLLNHREFRELGAAGDDRAAGPDPTGNADEDAAARILRRLSGDRAQLLVKRRSGIHVWRDDGSKMFDEFYPQLVLDDDEIEDATGAGDVFAAGLLAVLAGDRLQIELGSLLGMTLARHKLRYVGSHGHSQLAKVTSDFIGSLAGTRPAGAETEPGGVFIAHGRNPDWLAVKAFVEQRFGLPVYSFESNSWGSRPVTEALQEYLQRCTFAICVMTAEDTTEEGLRIARQNVIHEIGLFQGRHGFDRVLVLAEEGCPSLPDESTARTATFPRHAVDKAFWHLDRAMRESGFTHV
ncbi:MULTISPECIES: PfkB family carbohydrate kinase [Streptomyces]|uniref:Ribokinase n=1 Tax=Streptomyces tsukubensis (strain DSM 42081 / NBRC 108919 / NRRL 18488 / 9993) TaxID=1114943 RepID=I2MXH3_STRT9|nr:MULTISPECIES: PfkB family carbohydrate kinase [Streptomyces]AZK93848.1 ribokinase [Streptomyces tsukubensis]EIF89470.1 ribokinase [Streptomyces tsukubensis NRRL18488]MYS65284.1 ribokinase [Streptomyces sp. SID5473]QKM70020.1 ribokinase [Streptomyces tsukubensis NRRL18488]TAI46001.1 ribokinase [Streptomyces tsukubensis]